MVPSDVPTSETLTFVESHLPPGPARLLEVGCGHGELALRLQTRGHEVVAIDRSEKAVARARARGVEARRADWPDFDDPAPFDAVLFTRSLHHIGPLSGAVRRARELLRPRGRVLVEDFARHEVQPLAAEWLYQVLALLDGAGLLRRQQDPLLKAMRRDRDPLAAWQAAHDPHLHSAEAMRAALEAEFRRVETAIVPYLYRYVCSRLQESARGYRLARRSLAMERRLSTVGGVPLIGRRFVAARVDRLTLLPALARPGAAETGITELDMRYMQLTRTDQETLLAELAAMPHYLETAFGHLPAADTTRPGPVGAFSPVEHAWHLADLEREGYAVRLERLLGETAPALSNFDGARIAQERNYRSLSLAAGIDAFRAARAANLARLRAIAGEAWLRSGTQEGVGTVALCDLPAMMAEHDAGHRAEIETWLQAYREANPA